MRWGGGLAKIPLQRSSSSDISSSGRRKPSSLYCSAVIRIWYILYERKLYQENYITETSIVYKFKINVSCKSRLRGRSVRGPWCCWRQNAWPLLAEEEEEEGEEGDALCAAGRRGVASPLCSAAGLALASLATEAPPPPLWQLPPPPPPPAERERQQH